MRVAKLPRGLLGLGNLVVIPAWQLDSSRRRYVSRRFWNSVAASLDLAVAKRELGEPRRHWVRSMTRSPEFAQGRRWSLLRVIGCVPRWRSSAL